LENGSNGLSTNIVENFILGIWLLTGAKESLDMELADQLRYWLPLGSFSDHCLNVAMQQPNGKNFIYLFFLNFLTKQDSFLNAVLFCWFLVPM
jgi:hypothetical protein